MNDIELSIGGVDLTFRVEFVEDTDHGAPWEEEDGHGPVSDWECRDHYKGGKHPGELILNKSDRCNVDGMYRFYDFQEACKIALRDGWDAHPLNDGSETPRQQAAKAARADFERLRAWCNDEWSYVGVIVTLLDDDGNETPVSDQLFGVDTSGDYHEEQARLIADELAHGMGIRWDVVEKTSFDWIS